MRNLKKILALVLALVMSLSLMMTASAATDFKDDGSIEDYRLAIEVLHGLGVFNGDQDGNFNPKSEITRAEVAAIIYRIATGDTTGNNKTAYSVYGNQFTDVLDEDWHAGYVSYCHNAGYIKGHGDGSFAPNDPVTGYQVLTMILRAVGYDKNGEFTGDNWQINTASIATERGVLKNISGAPLGANASRELVAELLFRTILLNKVDWNAVTRSYTQSSEKLCKTIGLEEITGVVLANEYANLEGAAPLAADKTRLNVNGTTYNLDIGSELTDIGELRHAYVKDSTVFGTLENNGDSTVAQAANKGGAATSAVTKLMKVDSNTKYFVNFDDPTNSVRKAAYRTEYLVTDVLTDRQALTLVRTNGGTLFYDDANDLDANGNPKEKSFDGTGITNWDTAIANASTTHEHLYRYNKIIKLDDTIGKTDYDYIHEVFTISDGSNVVIGNEKVGSYLGWVSIGTRSGEEYDYSDTKTWRQFQDECIHMEDEGSFNSNDAGEWLKAIDNDGNGIADYVLRTDFVMTPITEYNNKTGEYLVEMTNANGDYVAINEKAVSEKGHLNVGDGIVMDTIKAADLRVGDLVLYTYIDGVYHIAHPETAEITIDRNGINHNAGTISQGENTYSWSGIDEAAENYWNRLEHCDTGVRYTLYLDLFGYVRLFRETDKGFVLLTDGYAKTDYRNWELKADMWDTEAKKSKEINVNYDSYAGAGFIDLYEGGDNGNRGTWLRLNEFGRYRYLPTGNGGRYYDRSNTLPAGGKYDPFYTNVAPYVVDGDGIYSFFTLEDASGVGAQYHSYQIAGTSQDSSWATTEAPVGSVSPNALTLYGINGWTGDRVTSTTRIQTRSTTQYYYVVVNGSTGSIETIDSWKGNNNVPSGVVVDRAYAITAEVQGVNAGDYYEDAQVVVIEHTTKPSNAYLIARYAERTRTRAADSTYTLYTLGLDMQTGEYTGEYVINNVPGYDPTAADAANGLYGFDPDTDLLTFVDSAGRSLNKMNAHISGGQQGIHVANSVYAGRVVTNPLQSGERYIQFTRGTDGNVPVDSILKTTANQTTFKIGKYTGTGNVKGYAVSACTLGYQDEVIYLKNGGEVGMSIDLTQSHPDALSHTSAAPGSLTDTFNVIDTEIRGVPQLTNMAILGLQVNDQKDADGNDIVWKPEPNSKTIKVELDYTTGIAASSVTTWRISTSSDTNGAVVFIRGGNDLNNSVKTDGHATKVAADAWNAISGNNALTAATPATDKNTVVVAYIDLVKDGQKVTYTVEITILAKSRDTALDTLSIKGYDIVKDGALQNGITGCPYRKAGDPSTLVYDVTLPYTASQNTTSALVNVAVTKGGSVDTEVVSGIYQKGTTTAATFTGTQAVVAATGNKGTVSFTAKAADGNAAHIQKYEVNITFEQGVTLKSEVLMMDGNDVTSSNSTYIDGTISYSNGDAVNAEDVIGVDKALTATATLKSPYSVIDVKCDIGGSKTSLKQGTDWSVKGTTLSITVPTGVLEQAIGKELKLEITFEKWIKVTNSADSTVQVLDGNKNVIATEGTFLVKPDTTLTFYAADPKSGTQVVDVKNGSKGLTVTSKGVENGLICYEVDTAGVTVDDGITIKVTTNVEASDATGGGNTNSSTN